MRMIGNTPMRMGELAGTVQEDQAIYDAYMKAHPYVPPSYATAYNSDGTWYGVTPAKNTYAAFDAWQALPIGNFKYTKAGELLKQVHIAYTFTGAPDLSNSDYQQAQFYTMLTDFRSAMREYARQYIAQGEHADALMNAYNNRQDLGPIFNDAFADYNSYFKQGQASPGKFTVNLARQAQVQWMHDHSPNLMSRIVDVVVPAFILIVGAMAIAGAGTAAGASSTGSTGATAAGSTGATAAGSTGATAASPASTVPSLVAQAGTVASGITVEQVASGAASLYQFVQQKKAQDKAVAQAQQQAAAQQAAAAKAQAQQQAVQNAAQTTQLTKSTTGPMLALLAAAAAYFLL